MRRNSLLIKVRLWNRLFTKNCVTRTETLHFSCVLFFLSPLDCCFRRSEFNNTLLYQNSYPSPILLEFRHSSPPLCKTHKKPEVDKKIQACETLALTEGSVFSSCRCSKQSMSCLLTLNLSEHFIWCGCFQICSGNNNASLLYTCEVIHLIRKRVTLPYVQE